MPMLDLQYFGNGFVQALLLNFIDQAFMVSLLPFGHHKQVVYVKYTQATEGRNYAIDLVRRNILAKDERDSIVNAEGKLGKR
jgi:hypothetical protein